MPFSRAHLPAVVVLAVALGLRVSALTATALWVDEAESSINAQTILEHGYPTDHYLGLPLFENTLVRPWPDHPEYEFKDISYSDRGMVVYHGWLPLYAMAASFAAFGVDPPALRPDWHLKADVDDMRRRTWIARLPSLVFSMVFLVALYRVADRTAGRDVALTALVIAGLSASLVTIGTFARYHAAVLALSALAACSLWRIVNRGDRRAYVEHGVVLVLLFHTHLFVFTTVCAITALALAPGLTDGVRLRRTAALFGATAACGLPWFVLSGFAEHMHIMRSGPRLLDFSRDVREYISDRIPYAIVYGLGGAWLAVVWALHGRHLPRRLREPWQRHGRLYALLIAWMVIATTLWLWQTPPASAWPDRLSLSLFVPGTLLLALLVTDACRMLTARSVALAPWAALAFLVGAGLFPPRPAAADPFRMIADTLNTVAGLDLPPSARVYASPNSHLVFTFYGQRPIQSLAPVRKAFLDGYPADVVFIETWLYPEFARPHLEDVQQAAVRFGEQLDIDDATEWVRRLGTRHAREVLAARVAHLRPAIEPLPPFAEQAVAEAVARQAPYLAAELDRIRALPIFRGYPIRNGGDFWTTFAYRLVNPTARSGASLNGHDRFRCGSGTVVPETNYVIYHSPAPCP